MAKKDTVAEIKAANGADLSPDDYTQAELDTLLALAKDPTKAEEFKSQAEGLKGRAPAQKSAAQESEVEEPTVRVTVNPDKGSGSYLHPVGKQVLVRGGEAVAVPDDAWTQDMVAKRFLTEVRK